MKKRVGVLLLCSLLSGCGLEFTYNQLDWLGRWYVNGYVSLSNPQKAEFSQRWNAQLDWHRQNELHRYVALLREFKLAVNAELKMDDLTHFCDQIEVLYRSTVAHLAPDLSYFAAQANDEQSQELLDSLTKKNRKWAKKYVTPTTQKRTRRRISDTTGRIEQWTGQLNPAQRNRVRAWNNQLQPIADEMLAHRIKWHTLLEQHFANRITAVSITPADEEISLTRVIMDPELLWSEQYHALIEHNKQASLGLVFDLFNQLSDKQMQHLNKKIDNTIADLEQLSTRNRTLLTQNLSLDQNLLND